MAMKSCKECGADISSSAKKCPQCGKKLKGNGLIIALIVLVVILVGMIGLGMGQKNEDEIKTSNEPKKEIYSIGEEAILGNGAITVTSVAKSQGSTYIKPKNGKEFVIVSVTIENKGNKNLSYNPFYFKMQNSQGQQESITFSASVDNNDTELNSGELIPGGKVSGTIAFEQPINDEGLILIYSDSIWSSKEIKIKL